MLIECDLFNHLAPEDIRAAAHYFGLSQFKQGETIFNEGDDGTFMCIVHKGNVSVLKANQSGQPKEVAKLGRSRTFGEMAVLDGERRSATCLASAECELLMLSKEAMDRMLEEHPRIGARIIRAIAVGLSRRLRMAVGQLVDHIV